MPATTSVCPSCEIHAESVFLIAGMDCHDEVAILDRRLKGLPGLERITADVLGGRLRIAYDAARLSTATIATDLGNITFELYTDSAPVASQNFINLADMGFYSGVPFHRLVPNFMIQGGDPLGTGRGGPGYTIPDEPVVGNYTRGIVAMARTSDPNSAGSQFFIVLDDSVAQSLPKSGDYVVFGKVTSGLSVVDQIAATPNSGSPNNLALDPVVMNLVTVQPPGV